MSALFSRSPHGQLPTKIQLLIIIFFYFTAQQIECRNDVKKIDSIVKKIKCKNKMKYEITVASQLKRNSGVL